MNRIHLISLAVISFALSAFAFADSSTVWEYRAKNIDLLTEDAISKQFNYVGKDGWELVTCTESDGSLTCIFKRLKK